MESKKNIQKNKEELYSLFSIESNQYFVKMQILYSSAVSEYWGPKIEEFRDSKGNITEASAITQAFSVIGVDNRLVRLFWSMWNNANDIKHNKDSTFEFEYNYAKYCAENFNKTLKSIFENNDDFQTYRIDTNKLILEKDKKTSSLGDALTKALQEQANKEETKTRIITETIGIINKDQAAEVSSEKLLEIENYLKKTEHIDVNEMCPNCHSRLILRHNRINGSPFWACEKFFVTGCSYTKDFQVEVKEEESRSFASGSRSKQAKVEFIQSLGTTSSFIEEIAKEEALYNEIKRFSHWRMDFIPTRKSAEDDVNYICSLAFKILTRGRVTTVSPEVEEEINRIFAKLINNPQNAKFYANYHSETRRDVSFWGEENSVQKKFYEDILPEIAGDSYNKYVIPLVDLESLVSSEDDLGEHQIDFIINDGINKIAIQIFDSYLERNKSYEELKGKVLEKSGYKVFLISEKDVLSRSGIDFSNLSQALSEIKIVSELPVDRDNYGLIALKIIHQVQIAIVYALLHNAISRNSNISLDINTDIFSESDVSVLKILICDDLNRVLNNLAKLCSFESTVFNIEITEKIENGLFEITFDQNKPISSNRYIVTDMVYAEDFVNVLPRYTNPVKYKLDIRTVEYFLNYVFRKPNFREGQFEAISNTLLGKDSLVLLPTGAGKSIAFQLASLLMPGITFVVSPLIALMEDQVDNLKRYGIDRVAALTGSMQNTSKKKLIEIITKGDVNITYISPERLQIQSFRKAIQITTADMPIPLFVIDEAHCLSEWGHDFRTAYLNLGRIIRDFCSYDNKEPIILALTGTASDNVLKDIKAQLGIWRDDSIIVPASFDRKELHYRIVNCKSDEKPKSLSAQLKMLPNYFGESKDRFYSLMGADTYCGVIFCPHINSTYGVYEVWSHLHTLGYLCGLYSGGKPKVLNNMTKSAWEDKKRQMSKNFKDNAFNILVATTAYGMGIDKPNIRFVIHYNMPSSIESYYQETGRAGRNSEDAECVLMASIEGKMGEFLESSSLDEMRMQEKNYAADDVSRVFYFHSLSFKGIAFELANVQFVLNKIKYDKEGVDLYSFDEYGASVESDDGNENSRIEKAIYRLLIIGVIGDYTKQDGTKYFITTKVVDKAGIQEAYATFVAKYHFSRVASEIDKIAALEDLDLSDYIIAVTKRLLEFLYENIERGRMRAIQSIYDLINEASVSGDQDATIRKGMVQYLQTTEQNQITDILSAPHGGFDTIRMLFETVYSTVEKRQVLRAQISRTLESAPDHPGLLISRALIDLENNNKKDDTDAIKEMKLAIQFARERYSLEEGIIASFVSWAFQRIYENNGSTYFLDLCNQLRDDLDDSEMFDAIVNELGENEIVVPFGYSYFNNIADSVINSRI